MKYTAIFTVLAVTLLSGAAMAQCRGEQIDQTAASCLPGMVWDEATATCVDHPTS
jgi:hypothetical protein